MQEIELIQLMIYNLFGFHLYKCLFVFVQTGESPKIKGDGDVRIFVALFPYDPASMSPNPDAAEEELPFSEGQIIKVCPESAVRLLLC